MDYEFIPQDVLGILFGVVIPCGWLMLKMLVAWEAWQFLCLLNDCLRLRKQALQREVRR